MRIAAIAACALALPASIRAESPAARPALPAVEASLMAPALRVSDCGKVQAFYQTALGMQSLMSRDLGSIHETMLAFATERQPSIVLICNLSAQQAPLKGIGASRMIVRVGNLDALVQRLDAAGLPHPQVHSPGSDPVRVLNLSDPEGNELELVQTTAAAPRSHP